MSGLTSFEDRVAVVTGAASGIGLALARSLRDARATVALVDRDEDALGRVAAELGPSCSSHVVDVTDRDAMRALPDAVLEAHGAVHLLVNNAGVSSYGPVYQLDLDEFERVMRVNVLGVVHGCRFFLEALRDNRPAWIVNNASILAHLAQPFRSAYCASKFAVRGFSEALVQELDGSGVGLTVVYAGAVRTNIMNSAHFADERVHERVVAYFERVGLPLEQAAEAILRAVRRGKDHVLVGPDAKAIYRTKRLAPRRADAWLNRIADRRMGLEELQRDTLGRFSADDRDGSTDAIA